MLPDASSGLGGPPDGGLASFCGGVFPLDLRASSRNFASLVILTSDVSSDGVRHLILRRIVVVAAVIAVRTYVDDSGAPTTR